MPGFAVAGSLGSGPSNQTETLRAHRYEMLVMSPVQRYLYFLKSCDRPSMSVDVMVQHLWQDEITMAGKSRWNPIEAVFYEVVGISGQLYNWECNNVILVNQSTTGSQSSYKFSCILSMLDGYGITVWSYDMKDVWPSSIEPSRVSFEDSGIATVKCTLNIGKCVQSGGDSLPLPTIAIQKRKC